MNKTVRIRKQGKFYSAFEDDAYVLHAVTGYKISNGRVGFPESAIGKVINTLERYKISYAVIEKDIEKEQKFFPKGKYCDYLKEGKKSFNNKKEEDELIEEIKNLSDEDLEKVIKFIKELNNV